MKTETQKTTQRLRKAFRHQGKKGVHARMNESKPIEELFKKLARPDGEIVK